MSGQYRLAIKAHNIIQTWINKKGDFGSILLWRMVYQLPQGKHTKYF